MKNLKPYIIKFNKYSIIENEIFFNYIIDKKI